MYLESVHGKVRTNSTVLCPIQFNVQLELRLGTELFSDSLHCIDIRLH